MQPLILDLDASVGALPDAIRIDARDWHDRLRFACSASQLRAFGERLETRFPTPHGTVFFGSGDFHHLSLPLIARLATERRMRVLVFDNHPDNMRFPFGVHSARGCRLSPPCLTSRAWTSPASHRATSLPPMPGKTG